MRLCRSSSARYDDRKLLANLSQNVLKYSVLSNCSVGVAVVDIAAATVMHAVAVASTALMSQQVESNNMALEGLIIEHSSGMNACHN
jgi:hypothetical protein